MPYHLSEESTMFIVVLIIGVAFMAIFIAFVVSQGPNSFVYQFVRSIYYDMMYFFFGPRIIEV
ncbi:MAG: hypothetical protein QXU82_01465 [Candidatus Aenigmatarchaeota archaeon]